MTHPDDDPIFESYLAAQATEAMALAADSDILSLRILSPQHFLAKFECKTLVRLPDGEIQEATEVLLGVHLHDGYLIEPNPAVVLTWMLPANPWHPNVSRPFLCIGEIAPGEALSSLLYRCYELVTYQNYGMVEFDALNKEACVWARHNQQRLPLDERPLKRRELTLHTEPPPADGDGARP